MLADGDGARKRTRISLENERSQVGFAPSGKSNRKLLRSAAAQVDIEESNSSAAGHLHELRHVKVRILQQVELVLQVEIEQPLHRAVRRHHAGGYARVLRLGLQLGPMFVSAAFGTAAHRKRNP